MSIFRPIGGGQADTQLSRMIQYLIDVVESAAAEAPGDDDNAPPDGPSGGPDNNQAQE